jgi:peptide/nickel transport system permease protein
MTHTLQRLKHHWRLTVGCAVLILITASALFAPWVAPHDPWALLGPPMTAPSGDYLLGTDLLGRDLLSGLIHGARVSLLVGLISTLCAIVIGCSMGAIAGYFGGLIDRLFMRMTEFFQVIPSFLFAILLVAIMTPGLKSVIVAIALVTWPPVARLMRAEFLSLRSREFVEAAHSLGLSHTQIILREILPNALPPVVAVGSLMVATAILTEASLSFLGLADPNLISWGYLIGASRPVFRQAWWLSVLPGLCLFVTVLAVNLIADGLSDARNPLLRRRAAQKVLT